MTWPDETRLRWLAPGLLAFLAGCGGAPPPPPPPPTAVEITFVAAGDANPDAAGRGTPVAVRYYQLNATGAFNAADYFQLHDKEAAILGPSLLERQDIALLPGSSQKVAFESKPGASVLGVVVSYRNIDQAQWRADAPIPPNQKTRLKVQIDNLKVSIVPDTSK
jgi:type VI secretion system protein VasD